MSGEGRTTRGDATSGNAMQPAAAVRVRDVAVDAEGISLEADEDRIVDFLFDGRRLGSFRLLRDTDSAGSRRMYRWPTALRRHLQGVTLLSLVDHVVGTEIHADEVRFGESNDRVLVQDRRGNPLGLDKSGRLMRLFDSRSQEHLDPLLDAIDAVIAELERCGVEPFLAYGTLLGAFRDGHLIGHDSDADLGYVSRHVHPADVILESFRLQRLLVESGYRITRYSGLAFKIVVEESDGTRRGLDVFGGFLRDGHLYLMGEVGHLFSEGWLRPRSEVLLEGRAFPAPARPEPLLEAMYGPGWKVPDPAFKFTTGIATQRRLTGWFRGTRFAREEVWDKYYHRGVAARRPGASSFVQWVYEREPDMATAVEVGCGAGHDVAWLAERGVNAWGLDYVSRAFRKQERKARARDLPANFRWANLSELRSMLVTGAYLARQPEPRVVLARHMADATNSQGRENLMRLARMATRGSGRFYLQVRSAASPGEAMPGVTPLNVDHLVELAERLGGQVLDQVRVADEEDHETFDSPSAPTGRPTISRLVIQWNH